DGASQVLDVGRATRTPPLPLRRAVEARDRRCRFGNCRRPPSWCDAHHIVHWSDDGPTDLDNLILLCDHHHNLIHHGGWSVELHPDNSATFTSPRGDSHTTQPGARPAVRHTEPAP
ncbi:MAG: HNH endonuclease, partial [Actinobacteria bacterium]|nr:HNH endonuclease [Actinomycetota bacterium]